MHARWHDIQKIPRGLSQNGPPMRGPCHQDRSQIPPSPSEPSGHAIPHPVHHTMWE